jgi:hypothetical protein
MWHLAGRPSWVRRNIGVDQQRMEETLDGRRLVEFSSLQHSFQSRQRLMGVMANKRFSSHSSRNFSFTFATVASSRLCVPARRCVLHLPMIRRSPIAARHAATRRM